MNCIAEGCTSGGKANLTTGLCSTCYKQRMTGRVYAGGRAVLTAPIHFRAPRSRNPQRVRLEQQYGDYQKETEQFADNHLKDWTDAERDMFVQSTNNILIEANNPEEMLNRLYTLAMELKRRLGAILWAYRMCWESEDYLNSKFKDPKNHDGHLQRIEEFEKARIRLGVETKHKLPTMLKTVMNAKKKDNAKVEEVKTEAAPAQV